MSRGCGIALLAALLEGSAIPPQACGRVGLIYLAVTWQFSQHSCRPCYALSKGVTRMPAPRTYPGVYVEEIPSGVRTIVGVSTSIAAFIGRALSGPVHQPVTINSYGDFERIFG